MIAHRSRGGLVVEISLAAMRGHAVPTGDQFRALELTTWPASEARECAGRRFVARSRAFRCPTPRGERPSSGAQRRTRACAPASAGPSPTDGRAPGPARWALEYLRVPDDQPWPERSRDAPPSNVDRFRRGRRNRVTGDLARPRRSRRSRNATSVGMTRAVERAARPADGRLSLTSPGDRTSIRE